MIEEPRYHAIFIRRDSIKEKLRWVQTMVCLSVVIDTKLGREDYGSISCNYDREGAETT
jgi:hypothetical protein